MLLSMIVPNTYIVHVWVPVWVHVHVLPLCGYTYFHCVGYMYIHAHYIYGENPYIQWNSISIDTVYQCTCTCTLYSLYSVTIHVRVGTHAERPPSPLLCILLTVVSYPWRQLSHTDYKLRSSGKPISTHGKFTTSNTQVQSCNNIHV